MQNKNWRVYILIFFCSFFSTTTSAQPGEDGLGPVIQITTRFKSFVGNPSWLLILRDIDHNQTIPYLFDIENEENTWIAFPYSKHYLISASELQFSPYTSDPYRIKRIHNFCNLESNGRILRNQSVFVTIEGDLTPNSNTYSCHVLKYKVDHFTIVPEDATP